MAEWVQFQSSVDLKGRKTVKVDCTLKNAYLTETTVFVNLERVSMCAFETVEVLETSQVQLLLNRGET